eukprot:3883372-Pleurochrysis_carterae.AAC.1
MCWTERGCVKASSSTSRAKAPSDALTPSSGSSSSGADTCAAHAGTRQAQKRQQRTNLTRREAFGVGKRREAWQASHLDSRSLAATHALHCEAQRFSTICPADLKLEFVTYGTESLVS